jgi:2-amino-4-hydroxy-6-hydroxymethyldihydropteridine diphosphokinase
MMSPPSPDRPWIPVYVGLGGNLDDPQERLRSARRAIGEIPGVRETAFSSLYRSAPMGPADQPDYVNAVMAIETRLPALELIARLQAIELAYGRVRNGQHWGPRTLDLDILLFGQESIASELLTVPHPGIPHREFVLYPLQEVAPGLEIPGLGPLEELVRQCPRRGLAVIEEA